MIRLAEHPKTEPNVMSVASTKLFERLRKEGVSLIDVIYKAENQNANFQPQSNLVMKNAHLNTEVFHQKTMIAKLEKKVFTLGKRLAVAQNDNAELREASKKAKAKFSERIESASKTNDAKIAALKAELKSARARAAADRADLAAERAKPAPISATVVVALAKMTRDQEAEITRLKGALAKANAAAAPIPINTPASAPAASAGLSKRSQGAFKASATPPANAAASPTAAPKAPRETLTTRVVDILKSCQGMSMDAQDLAERLATNRAYENKSFNWHKCLSDQLRTEVLSQKESLRKYGVTVISVPFGTRMTHRFVWTGKGGQGEHVQPTYSFPMSATKFKDVREIVSDQIDPATWSVTGGRRKGVKSVRIWVKDVSAATMFKLAC